MNEAAELQPIASNVQMLRTDAVIAVELRAEMMPLLEKLADVMNKARNAGLHVGFGVHIDAYGRFAVQPIQITRPL
jgi:hypothetical protein